MSPSRHASTPIRLTRVVLNSPICRIKLEIEGDFHLRQRRAIAVALLKQIRAPMRELLRFMIDHRDGHYLQFLKQEDRGLNLKLGPGLATETEKIGFIIRMRRLELGLTVRELAEKAGVDRSHLGKIERGEVRLREVTRHRLGQALAIDLKILDTEVRRFKNPKTPEVPC